MTKTLKMLCGGVVVLAVAMQSRGDLLGFYELDGDLTDSSGNGNHGVDTGNGVTFAVGFEGQAGVFDGSGDRFDVPININPSAIAAITMGAWVNRDNVSTGTNRAIISHDDGGFDRQLTFDTRSGGPGYGVFNGVGVSNSGTVTTSVWTFVAVVYNGANSALYVDNQKTTFSATNGVGFTDTRIGARRFTSEHWSGLIDNAFIIDEALTDEDIEAIRTGGAEEILSYIPEPTSIALMGLMGLAALRRR